MSTHSYPIVFVGETFENDCEALDYIYKYDLLTQEEYEVMKAQIKSEDCALEECLDDKFKDFPNSEWLNPVTGYGYFLGYTICAYKMQDDMPGYLKDIEVAKENWKAIFKEDGKLCMDVQVS